MEGIEKVVEQTEEEIEKRFQEVLNQTGERVHTTLMNYVTVLSRKAPNMALPMHETRAILMGAISGVAVLVARMQLGHEPGLKTDKPPEILMIEEMASHFLQVIEHTRKADGERAMREKEATGATDQ